MHRACLGQIRGAHTARETTHRSRDGNRPLHQTVPVAGLDRMASVDATHLLRIRDADEVVTVCGALEQRLVGSAQGKVRPHLDSQATGY